jgi:pimeloyl-ACP methyl ester carboxylesterase
LSRLLAVGNHRLEYESWSRGSRGADTLFLLHEGLGSVGTWRDVPARIAACTGWRVIAYSRLGHGASDAATLPRTVGFMHEEAIEVLPAVLDALHVERPVLFGHSDGGSIALIFAATNPGRVRGLVLEAPHVFVEDVSVASIARMKSAYETTDLRERLARHHGANVDVVFRGWNDIWLAPEFRAWNIEPLLPRVACPVLVIQGEDDEYGTLEQVSAIAAQAGGRVETLVLSACGHAPHRDQPERVFAAVDGFLRSVSG